MADGVTIYRVVDESGRVLLVTDPEDAPAHLRDKLEVAVPQGSLAIEPAMPTEFAGVHLPSLALGLAVGAAVGGLVATRRRSRIVRVLVLAGGLALVAGLYLGVVRRMAGMSEGDGLPFASPSQIIDDAKAARDAANAQTDAKEKAADALRDGD